MLGDPYLMMGQAQTAKVVLGAQPEAQDDSTRRPSHRHKARRWADLRSPERVQRLAERGRP